MERLESIIANGESGKGSTPPPVEAEVVVTKDSLKKVRDAIMNLFR